MAKDGTTRGGARIGAGRKSKSVEEKRLEGVENLPQKIKENQKKIKNPKPYLAETQKDGTKTFARQIYRETYDWLQKYNCADSISAQLVESFSEVMARHIQAEMQISQTGFIIRQPTTGEPILSPLVKVSLDYLKAAQQIWYQISQAVKENGTFNAADEAVDAMENLLNFKRR